MPFTLLFLLLVLSGWFCATISGTAGFGGALLLLPLLTYLLGVKAAIPVLAIAQLFGNASRMWFGRTEIKWRPVICFISTAIPFSVIGSQLFIDLPDKFLLQGIGSLLFGIVVFRRLKITRLNFGNTGLLVGGALTGFISGIAGSAGPLGAAFFLGLDLPPVSYIPSEAVTALSMHITKTIMYQKYALIGINELGYGLLIGGSMILGSWTGKKIIEKLPREKYVLSVEILLVVSAMQLLFFQ